jgi:hypothetical protein
MGEKECFEPVYRVDPIRAVRWAESRSSGNPRVLVQLRGKSQSDRAELSRGIEPSLVGYCARQHRCVFLHIEAGGPIHTNQNSKVKLSPHSAAALAYSSKPTAVPETSLGQLLATRCLARKSLPELCRHRVRRPRRAPRHHSKPASADRG